MRSRSGAVVVAVAALIVVCLSSALVSRSTPQVEDIVVQDWTAQPLGSTGVPVGWSAYETFGGRPRYDFAVVEDDGRRALDLRSRDDHSTIVKKIHVDLRTTPILEWSWKMVALPAGADIRKKSTSDLSGHIFVVWPRLGMLRARLIGYAWGTAEPAPSVERSRKTGAVTFFVSRSGPKDLHRWMNERRNVYADYRTAFGEDPDDARAVALSIDTNDTHSTAEALIGRIAFTAGQ